MTRPNASAEALALFATPTELAAMVRADNWPFRDARVLLESIEGWNLEGGTIVDTDFEVGELRGATWRDLTVRRCNFSLDTALNLSALGVRFEDCAFLGGHYRDLAFERCSFVGCEWSGLTLDRAAVADVMLVDGKARGLTVNAVTATRTRLVGTLFAGVGCFETKVDDLAVEGGRLERVRLGGGRFGKINLAGTGLEAVEATQTSIRDAVVSGGDLANCSQSEGRLAGLVVRTASRLFGLTLAGVMIDGFTLEGVEEAIHLDVVRSELRNLRVSGSTLIDADLRGSLVSAGALVEGSTVDGLDLTGAVIDGLALLGGRLAGPVQIDRARIRGWALNETELASDLAITGRDVTIAESDSRLRPNA